MSEAKSTALAVAPTTDDGAAIEALVMRGDISALEPKQRAAYYVQLCASLRLNPATQPIKFIAFQGKTIPYFTRDATDQLAARDRLNREIVAGPEVRDFCGHKMLYALCRGTLPNGRVETATAVVTIPNGGGENLANAIMRTETKARRRVTLAILGLGFISEDELDTMSGARKLTHAEVMGAPAAAPARVEVTEAGPPTTPELDRLADDLESADTAEGVRAAWDDNAPALMRASGDSNVVLARGRQLVAERARAIGAARTMADVDALMGKGGQRVEAQVTQLDAIDQIEADYARAASLAEVTDIAREAAKLNLVKGSAVHKRLAAAYRAAVARLSPRGPGPQGGKPAPANDAAEATGDAYEGPDPGDELRAKLDEWTHIEHALNSIAKHRRAWRLTDDAIREIAFPTLCELGKRAKVPMGAMQVLNGLRAALHSGARRAA